MALDMGQVKGYAVWGHPKTGRISLRADQITLPPLPAAELAAMLELKSEEGGVGVPDSVWDPADHPCSWGGPYPGLDPSCCLRDDGDTVISASVTSIDLNMWWNAHRGGRHASNFQGTVPSTIGNLTSLRSFATGSNRWGVQGAHLNPLGLFLEPPGLCLRTF